MRRRWALLVIALCVATLGHARVASAQEAEPDLTWSVRPAPAADGSVRPNFSFAAEPGATVQDSVEVANRSSVDLALGVYAADAFNTPSGGTDLLSADQQATDVGAWVVPHAASITVPAGGSVVVPFTLTVPADATPGDHTGGIVTSLVGVEADADGNRVRVERRLGSRVYVRVPGALDPALTFRALHAEYDSGANPLAGGTMRVTYEVANVGNVRLRAARAVEVAGTFGPDRRARGADLPELLPGNSFTFTQVVDDVWPTFGTDVEVRLAPYDSSGASLDSEPAVVAARTHLDLWPWPQFLMQVILLGIAAIWWWLRRRGRRRTQRAVDDAVEAALIGRHLAGDLQSQASVTGRSDTDEEVGSPLLLGRSARSG